MHVHICNLAEFNWGCPNEGGELLSLICSHSSLKGVCVTQQAQLCCPNPTLTIEAALLAPFTAHLQFSPCCCGPVEPSALSTLATDSPKPVRKYFLKIFTLEVFLKDFFSRVLFSKGNKSGIFPIKFRSEVLLTGRRVLD